MEYSICLNPKTPETTALLHRSLEMFHDYVAPEDVRPALQDMLQDLKSLTDEMEATPSGRIPTYYSLKADTYKLLLIKQAIEIQKVFLQDTVTRATDWPPYCSDELQQYCKEISILENLKDYIHHVEVFENAHA